MGEETAQFVLIGAAVIILVIAILVLVVDGVNALAKFSPLVASLENALDSVVATSASIAEFLIQSLSTLSLAAGRTFLQLASASGTAFDGLLDYATAALNTGLSDATSQFSSLFSSVTNASTNGLQTLTGATQVLLFQTVQVAIKINEIFMSITAQGTVTIINILSMSSTWLLSIFNYALQFFSVVLEPILVVLILPTILPIFIVVDLVFGLVSFIESLVNKVIAAAKTILDDAKEVCDICCPIPKVPCPGCNC